MKRNVLRSPYVNPTGGANSVPSPQCPHYSASRVICEQAWGPIARSLRLSARELQIVRGMFEDRTELSIAADLGIARRTVHTHFERLHRKLHVVDRLQLALRVMAEFLALTVSAGNNLPPICAEHAAGRCALA